MEEKRISISKILRIILYFENFNDLAHKSGVLTKENDFFYDFFKTTYEHYLQVKDDLLSLNIAENMNYELCDNPLIIKHKDVVFIIGILNNINIFYQNYDIEDVLSKFTRSFYKKISKVYYKIIWDWLPDKLIEEKFDYGGIDYYLEYKKVDLRLFMEGKIFIDDESFCKEDALFHSIIDS
jgi:hypothetical protein